jgi:endoglucanase
MNSKAFAAIARRLMSCPAAPYYEAAVRAVVEQICEENRIAWKRDRFGNLLAHVGDASAGRLLVLAAHLDHPGFELVRRLGPRRWLARFNGGVPDSYFRPGLRLRLLPGATPARLGRRRETPKEFEIELTNDASAEPRFAVWELEDFALRRGRIYARACDDLGGVTAILATLIELKRLRSRTHVIGLFSRAEEVGFQGALTVADSKLLPKDSLIVSLETSRELPPVKMGEGVIIRVGDRVSIFDPTATRFLMEVAAELRARAPKFKFQRALMFGGACEATAFQEFGFQIAAVCVALGNYHNCAPTGRIAPEFVSLDDACGMVDLLVESARRMRDWRRLTGKLPARLRDLLRTARRRLQQPAS